ncbi:MAG: hypothetical protein A2857_06635 [Candidatus Levybacteria bacterium RIFCSPHIGHO2_01_FULL_36_15]|nr:MAG: hypothetical protein A2857_06635 [Candidatus Levybacteria bacterium RIFCSPHIGHO2_01_FULL_36_15]OGH38803.1 MAG: hypothetical protein A2905_02480 [Candidatus Levybacteria bacterium RIFCSPLOWO2_01_FULL_36_10]
MVEQTVPGSKEAKRTFDQKVTGLAKLGKKTITPLKQYPWQAELSVLDHDEKYEARFKLPGGRILSADHTIRHLSWRTVEFNSFCVVEVIPRDGIEILCKRTYNSSGGSFGYTDSVYGYIDSSGEFQDSDIYGFNPECPDTVKRAAWEKTHGRNGEYIPFRKLEQAKEAIDILDRVDTSKQFPKT